MGRKYVILMYSVKKGKKIFFSKSWPLSGLKYMYRYMYVYVTCTCILTSWPLEFQSTTIHSHQIHLYLSTFSLEEIISYVMKNLSSLVGTCSIHFLRGIDIWIRSRNLYTCTCINDIWMFIEVYSFTNDLYLLQQISV